MCQFLDIKDFGPNDIFILNNDLGKDSVTQKELKGMFHVIFNEHKSKPETH